MDADSCNFMLRYVYFFQNHFKTNWIKWHVIWQMPLRLSKFERRISCNKKTQVIRNGCTTSSSDSLFFMLCYVYIFKNHFKTNWIKWHVIWQMAFRLSKFERRISHSEKTQVICNGCTTVSSDSYIFMLFL